MEKTHLLAKGFETLHPDLVLQSVERARLFPTGEYTQLNSYENRVFDIRLEVTPQSALEVERVIVKFYRPGRWSKQAILEEHEFAQDLEREGLPTSVPYSVFSGSTVLDHEGFYVSLFPKVRGRLPQEFIGDELLQIGRRLALLHNVGSRKPAPNRPRMDTETFGWIPLENLERWVSPELWRQYYDVSATILERLEDVLEPNRFLRIHGDCHRGNLLHDGREFFFVDFDDFCMGPEIQDFWMLLTGDEDERRELDQLLEGYEELRHFPDEQLEWIPLLRGLRIIKYAHWIAEHWEDPSFHRIFPEFPKYLYWLEELRQLEKIANSSS